MRALLKFFLIAWLCAAILCVNSVLADELVVVTRKDSSFSELSNRQVSDLYLGRLKQINGTTVKTYDLPSDDMTRADFFEQLNGMSLSQINAYWARLKFTGRIFPPKPLSSIQAVLEAITLTPDSIGYLPANEVTDAVKIVNRLQ